MRDRYIFIIIMSIIGLVVCLAAWHVNISNEEFRRNTWYLNATVIDKNIHWYGNTCILLGDNNKRYAEECSDIVFVGDRIELFMNKERAFYIERWFGAEDGS